MTVDVDVDIVVVRSRRDLSVFLCCWNLTTYNAVFPLLAFEPLEMAAKSSVYLLLPIIVARQFLIQIRLMLRLELVEVVVLKFELLHHKAIV